MNDFTHEEIISVIVALESHISSLLNEYELITDEESKAAARHIIQVNRAALTKANDINNKYKSMLDNEV